MFRWVAAILACLLIAPVVHAGSNDAKARKKLFARQTAVLDKKTAARQSPQVHLGPSEVYIPGAPSSEVIPRFAAQKRSQYESAARQAARRHNVPEDLFLRLVSQESAWNPGARSHKGAIGLAQLMPATAAKLRVNPHLALAAYNAGPAAVQKYNGVPPYKETRGYVRAILGG